MFSEVVQPAGAAEGGREGSPTESFERSPATMAGAKAPEADISRENPKPLHRVQNDRDRWLVDALLLICLLAIVAAKCIIPGASIDQDYWWHARTGDWILEHRAVPMQDFFSTYTSGAPLIAYSWLFDVLSAWVYNHWSFHGVLTMTTLLTLSFVAAVVLLLSQYGRMVRALALASLVF